VARRLNLALIPFVIGTIVGLIVLWPAHQKHRSVRALGTPAQLVNATVTQVDTGPCQQQGAGRCSTVYVTVTSGADHGHSAILPEVALGPGVAELHRGDKVVLGRTVDPTDGHVDYYFDDYQRRTPMLLLAILFAVLVVVVGRWRGVAALVGLLLTGFVLLRFIIPSILDGNSPVSVALVGSAAIIFVVIYVAHGFSPKTTTALLGTLASLALTAGFATLFVAATHLTGLSSDETTSLQSTLGSVPLQGLILAGIIIGSLGVLNDVTVTQASSVWEIHDANTTRSARELYRAGMRVGRDHIASTVYTLVLAYAGASLPLLILFSLSNQRFVNVLTGDLVGQEIVRALVGSIGLVASVPLTTALAAAVVRSSVDGVSERSEGTDEQSAPRSEAPPKAAR
jgi:uncharacterized membrane protein